jgi:phosphotriesterase-related protein
MYVQTVLGPIEPTAVGNTLMHEHVLSLSPEGWLPAGIEPVKAELATRALARFRAVGGQTVVDLTTNDGMAGGDRDPQLLAQVSAASGLNIVVASAFYKDPFLPEWVQSAELDELVELHVREAQVGIGETGIRAGIYGEVGTGLRVITPNEEKCLRAISRAHRATGLPISTHCSLGSMALEQIAIFRDEGVDLGKVVLGHLDLDTRDEYLDEVLSHGVTIGFDTLGKEEFDYVVPGSEGDGEGAYVKWAYRRPDSERVRALARLLSKGHAGQIVLSMDITGPELHSNDATQGANGYSHVADVIVPALRSSGVTEKAIETMVIANPVRILAIG